MVMNMARLVVLVVIVPPLLLFSPAVLRRIALQSRPLELHDTFPRGLDAQKLPPAVPSSSSAPSSSPSSSFSLAGAQDGGVPLPSKGTPAAFAGELAALVDPLCKCVDPAKKCVQDFRFAQKSNVQLDQHYNEVVYVSQPIRMGLASEWRSCVSLPMPGPQAYAIRSWHGEIIGEDGSPVSLDSIYLHHWTVRNAMLSSKKHMCSNVDENFVASQRSEAHEFPIGHGLVVPEPAAVRSHWSADVHLIRTEGLAGSDPHLTSKACRECPYNHNPACNSQFGRCVVGLNQTGNAAARVVYVKYTVIYTYDVHTVQPVSIGWLASPKCTRSYSVMRSDKHPVHLMAAKYTLPGDFRLLKAWGHMHTGAINISVWVDGEHLCTSSAQYGKHYGVAGDEECQMLNMTTCLLDSGSDSIARMMKGGSILELRSYYWVGGLDKRFGRYEHLGGTHFNVMAYIFLAYEFA